MTLNDQGVKPQFEVFADQYERDGYDLFKKLDKDPDNIELWLKAASSYEKSVNPEGKSIASLLTAIYFWKKSKLEASDDAAVEYLLKAREAIKQAGVEGEQADMIEIEYLGRRLASLKEDVAKSPTRQEILFQRAELLKKVGRETSYHADMALYYMFLLTETAQTNEEKALEHGRLMVEHAEQSKDERIIYKLKSIFHQFRAGASGSFVDSLPDLEEALQAVQQTKDRYGEEELRNRVQFTRAMLTKDKAQRREKLLEVAEQWRAMGKKEDVMHTLDLITPFPVRAVVVLQKIDEATEQYRQLTSLVQRLAAPIPAGPYALFHHLANVHERLESVKVILTRLGNSKTKLKELAMDEAPYRSQKSDPGKPFPKELQEIFAKQDVLTQQMKLDMESLYIFGNLLLDQWAHTIAYLCGLQNPDNFGYRGLVELLQSAAGGGIIAPLWLKHKNDILWLFYQLKFYRNIFIEHIRRPWQRGTTMSAYGDDFNFFICTPPGWIPDEKVEQMIKEIAHLAPQALLNMPDDYWEKARPRRYLEVTFNHIDQIERQADREKVSNVWQQVGGSTPAYFVIGHRLIRLISDSSKTIKEIVTQNPTLLNLGQPPRE